MAKGLTLRGIGIRDIINDLLNKGIKTRDIEKKMSKEFHIGERQVRHYLLDVKKEIIKRYESNKEANMSRALETKRYLYENSLTPQTRYSKKGEKYTTVDYKLANDIHNDQCKLNGLFVERIVHESTTPLSINIQVNAPQSGPKPITILRKD